MRRCNPFFVVVLILALATAVAPLPSRSADPATPQPAPTAAETPADETGGDKVAPPTEITADSMEYDLQAKLARLTGNVKVVDAQMSLTANEMTVHFDAENNIQRIEATGDVRIIRDKNIATSGKAVFDVEKGMVTLTGEPVLRQGNSRISNAERVIYLRNEGRFRFEGGKPKIELYRESGNDSPALDILPGMGKQDAPNAPN